MGDDIHQDLIPGDGRQGRRNRRGPQQAAIAVQTKEFTTGAHLHMLLQVVDSLCHNLRAPSLDDTGTPTRQHMEGEVKLALEGSIIKACYAIDSVIGESVRWSVEDSLDAEKKVRAVMQANVDFLQAQAKAAAHVTRPCVRFQPRLVKLTDGTYACYLGDILTGNAIVGQGPHPEAALEAFDEQFAGKTSQQMKEWIQQKTANEKFPLPEEAHEAAQERPMDPGPTKPTPGYEKPGKERIGNSGGPRRRRLPRPKQNRKTRKHREQWDPPESGNAS